MSHDAVSPEETARRRARRRLLAAIAAGAIFIAGAVILATRGGREERHAESGAAPAAPPTFAGSAACASCHPAEHDRWRGSDHDRAMQVADERTVLGDFGDAAFTHHGVTSTFHRKDGKHVVRTEGPDGRIAEYPIAYTFGADPLQQYLVPFPGGRLQSLTIAWDSRPAGDGGRRWFSLYPDERIPPGDSLHWTGRDQNWNNMCAECHSTDLRRGYDPARDEYSTAWSELNVACEACHGPGSAHVAWAKGLTPGTRAPDGAPNGLTVRLKDAAGGGWAFDDPATGIARWSGPPRTTAGLDVCAPCHSRRSIIARDPPPGTLFLDAYMPSLLEPALYHADGQILGEVYEYGSFLQSKMHRAGVTCFDCHEPHSLELRAPGNEVCSRCHLPARFDSPSHHHHEPGTTAALCVSCHMPARRYMIIDPRRDHGFRVPRPDHTVALGTPNACADCHGDRPALWAAEAVARWYGPGRGPARHFAPAIDAGRRGLPAAERLLADLVLEPGEPGIARATAVGLLAGVLSPASAQVLAAAAADGDPLVRMSAARSLDALPPEARSPIGGRLLGDPVRAVRIEAARSLAGAERRLLPADIQLALGRATDELVAAERIAADRPESHLNLSLIRAATGRLEEAEAELRTALRLDPRFVPALVNLADIERERGRDGEGEKLLQKAIEILPGSAEALHALGLLRARQGRHAEAIDLLRRAAEIRPENVRLSYVHAIALQSSGDLAGALSILERAHARHPADREVLGALATISREKGDLESAGRWAEKLLDLSPGDPEVRAFVEEMRRR
jgi:tetratricopeptide (TPR) repeat protein